MDLLNEALSQDDAAIRIQSPTRGRLARKQVAQKREEDKAARIMQSQHRGRKAREDVKKLREERSEQDKAARIMQARERGRRAREEFKTHRERHEAAVKIQSPTRGRLARRLVSEMNKDGEVEDITEKDMHGAAVAIQSPTRGRLVRKQLAKEHSAAIAIQSPTRGRLARRRLAEVNNEDKTEVVENEEDMDLTQSEQHNAARIMQSRERGRRARKEFEIQRERHHAAVKIQSPTRGRLARRRFSEMKSEDNTKKEITMEDDEYLEYLDADGAVASEPTFTSFPLEEYHEPLGEAPAAPPFDSSQLNSFGNAISIALGEVMRTQTHQLNSTVDGVWKTTKAESERQTRLSRRLVDLENELRKQQSTGNLEKRFLQMTQKMSNSISKLALKCENLEKENNRLLRTEEERKKQQLKDSQNWDKLLERNSELVKRLEIQENANRVLSENISSLQQQLNNISDKDIPKQESKNDPAPVALANHDSPPLDETLHVVSKLYEYVQNFMSPMNEEVQNAPDSAALLSSLSTALTSSKEAIRDVQESKMKTNASDDSSSIDSNMRFKRQLSHLVKSLWSSLVAVSDCLQRDEEETDNDDEEKQSLWVHLDRLKLDKKEDDNYDNPLTLGEALSQTMPVLLDALHHRVNPAEQALILLDLGRRQRAEHGEASQDRDRLNSVTDEMIQRLDGEITKRITSNDRRLVQVAASLQDHLAEFDEKMVKLRAKEEKEEEKNEEMTKMSRAVQELWTFMLDMKSGKGKASSGSVKCMMCGEYTQTNGNLKKGKAPSARSPARSAKRKSQSPPANRAQYNINESALKDDTRAVLGLAPTRNVKRKKGGDKSAMTGRRIYRGAERESSGTNPSNRPVTAPSQRRVESAIALGNSNVRFNATVNVKPRNRGTKGSNPRFQNGRFVKDGTNTNTNRNSKSIASRGSRYLGGRPQTAGGYRRAASGSGAAAARFHSKQPTLSVTMPSFEGIQLDNNRRTIPMVDEKRKYPPFR